MTEENKIIGGIGVLNEKSLHRQLINYFSRDGDEFEVPYLNYFIDIIRGEELLEVQTRNIFAIKKKLMLLTDSNPVTLIHPLISKKMLIRKDAEGNVISQRKSPKKNRIEDIFYEIFRCGELLTKNNLKLVIPFIDFEEYWKDDGKGSWRRGKWSLTEKKLIDVTSVTIFDNMESLIDIFPPTLPELFTNKDIANHLQLPIKLARKISYTFRIGNLLEIVDKNGNANIYKRTNK